MRLSATVHTVLAAAALAASTPALADFVGLTSPVTTTVSGGQTLSSGTGTVASSGILTRSSGDPTLTINGTSTLVNDGTIRNTGTGRAVNNSGGNGNTVTVTNNGSIWAQESDAFRMNTNSAVTLYNSGSIYVVDGGQALDWAAITSQSNTVNNYSTGIISASGSEAIVTGTAGIVNNAGTITTSGADAIRLGNNGTVTNYGTISATLVEENPGKPAGGDGIDLRVQRNVTVTNTGTISGRHGIATDGENVGASSLTLYNNAGTIEGLNGSGVNIDGVNTSVTAYIENAVDATIKGGVVSWADEADGDGIDVDGVLTLYNFGDVLGLGAKGAGNNAEGIAAGGGTIVNYTSGRIIGTADAPNGDPGKAGNGILIDNSSGGSAIAATTVYNEGLIQGVNGFGIKFVGAFDDTINNSGTIRGAGTEAAIQTGGGNDTVYITGAVISDTGNAIDLGEGSDQLTVLGYASALTAPSIIGNISGGGNGANTVADFLMDPGVGFTYAGVLSNFAAVVIAGGGEVTFSGENTYVGSTQLIRSTLILDGANRISSNSVLFMTGGDLVLENAGGPNGQTFSGFVLGEDATIDLGQSSLTFNLDGHYVGDSYYAGGPFSVEAGATLSLLNFYAITSPGYAIRFTGDLSENESFLTLISHTTINGLAAIFNFDGAYTNVLLEAPAPVPLPAAWIMLMSGLGALGAAGRRKHAMGNPATA